MIGRLSKCSYLIVCQAGFCPRLAPYAGWRAADAARQPHGPTSVRRFQVQVSGLLWAVLVGLVAHHADEVEFAVVHTALGTYRVGKRGDQCGAAAQHGGFQPLGVVELHLHG